MYETQKIEKEILDFWSNQKIFDKLRKQNKGNKTWSFIDGPITANNPMGVHHAWGRTYKDLFHRFKAMQGYEMRYQNGFDCQGLWVEREEEKELGLKNKEDIEKFGILKFVQACKKRVEKFSKIQTDQSIRLGYWMDWENSYYTMRDTNNLHNWHLLKTYFDKGWLFKGKDAVPWCWRCGTASSKHDIATEGYKDVTHKAIFMQFPLKDKPKEYFLIFTTTPWTVPANVAIAVNKKIDYIYAKQKNSKKIFIVAEALAEKVLGGKEFKILKKVKGKELEGIEYDMPYKDFEPQKNSPHKVVLWELASEEEGTGIVHIAPGCGTEDFELGKKEKLPAISPLDDAGVYKEGFGEYSLKKYSEVNRSIIQNLEDKNFLYKKENIHHRYPHCWRCGEELVFRLVDEWYIKGEDIRNLLIKENKKITWYPEYGKIRQEDWFKNMGDWLISRKRYWGLPLPIWECECGNIEVIGNLKELKEKAVDKKKVAKLPEIHRPWIDKIKLKCKCGKEIERIKDVGDAWLDAGIVPFSTIGPYLENKKEWEKWFPADLISENMPGQFRGWFNSLFWASTTLTGKAPFKTLFGYETLKDEKGEEMHKSKGNAIWFDDAVEKVGADSIRFLYGLQHPAQELRFGFNNLREPKNNLNILYNISKLIGLSEKTKISKVEDKWILSKFNTLINTVTEELNNLHPHLAIRALKDFWLNDLSRGYIKIVRDRIFKQDNEAKDVLSEIYINLIKLCAPIVPFLTEKVWQDLRDKNIVKLKSVHLASWPKANKKLIDKKLENEFETLFGIIEKGLAERDREQMGLKWPLAKADITSSEKLSKTLHPIILNQLNLKKVNIKQKPAKLLNTKSKKKQVTMNLMRKEVEVKLDTKLTPELEAEGYARQISRQVQSFRKKLGLQTKDKVNLWVIVDESFKNILENQEEFIKERTNSKKINIVTTAKETFKNKIDFKIKDKKGVIAII